MLYICTVLVQLHVSGHITTKFIDMQGKKLGESPYNYVMDFSQDFQKQALVNPSGEYSHKIVNKTRCVQVKD